CQGAANCGSLAFFDAATAPDGVPLVVRACVSGCQNVTIARVDRRFHKRRVKADHFRRNRAGGVVLTEPADSPLGFEIPLALKLDEVFLRVKIAADFWNLVLIHAAFAFRLDAVSVLPFTL